MKDCSPMVSIMTCILMATSVLGVTVKVWLKGATFKADDADDGVLVQ